MSERMYAAGNRFFISSFGQRIGLLMLAVVLCPPLIDTAPAQDRPAAEESEGGTLQPRRPRGRLPTYFARVVTAQQRETIYDLQMKYQEQLDVLLEQVQKLEQQRDMEVFDVLSPEQQQQVTAWTEEARQRRAAGRASPSPRNDSPENEN